MKNCNKPQLRVILCVQSDIDVVYVCSHCPFDFTGHEIRLNKMISLVKTYISSMCCLDNFLVPLSIQLMLVAKVSLNSFSCGSFPERPVHSTHPAHESVLLMFYSLSPEREGCQAALCESGELAANSLTPQSFGCEKSHDLDQDLQ